MKRLFIFAFGLMMACLASGITPLYAEPKAIQLSAATVLSPPKPLEVDFSLQDTSNKPFTPASLKGHWTVLFFGYAQCPEICPQTLAIVSEAWRQKLDPNAQFVFVSLDPKTDTV